MGVRCHCAWLRMRLRERGLIQVVKRIGSKEMRVVNVILHRASKRIVNLAIAGVHTWSWGSSRECGGKLTVKESASAES